MNWKRIRLFLSIVYRYDWTETRMRPKTAWEVAGIMHPSEEVK